MSPQDPPTPSTLTQEPASKKERQERRKKVYPKKSKEEGSSGHLLLVLLAISSRVTPEASSNGSSRSIQPSPMSATSRPPKKRAVDENYDEGVADALINLSSYRAPDNSGLAGDAPSHSPTIPLLTVGTLILLLGPLIIGVPYHRNKTVSSPSQSAHLKRGLRSGPEENENERSRVDMIKRRISPSGGIPST